MQKTDSLGSSPSQEPITLYIDHLSQPSRAVYALIKYTNIPHKVINIRVQKGDHLSPEFTKLNPLQFVPFIIDQSFPVSESHTIMRYLCNSRSVDDHWYPKDPKKRANVDRYLDWHHTNTRRCASYLVTFFPTPKTKVLKIDRDTEKQVIDKTLDTMENYFLGNTMYILSDEMTIADLAASSELIQLKLIKFDYNGYPKVKEWLERCQNTSVMKEVNGAFNKVLSMIATAKL